MNRDLYPSASNRAAWDSLPAADRSTLIQAGEAALQSPWPALTATQMLQFVRTGDRVGYQTPHFVRRTCLRDLVLAECVEGKGRFIEAMTDGLWSTCEESYWGWPAHLSMQQAGPGLADVNEPTVDLGVGESAALVAWTTALLREQLDAVSPLLVRRASDEVRRRVLDPCLNGREPWWMASSGARRKLNNWTPWCCSNWLVAVILLEDDAKRRDAALARILHSLEAFVAGYGDDGGCDEGPMYWDRAAGSLFDCLDLLHRATDGQVNWFDRPRVKEMARYIQRVHITDDWFVNFADASAKGRPDGSLIARFGRRIDDDSLVAFGSLFPAPKHNEGGLPASIQRVLGRLFHPAAGTSPAVSPRDVWFPSTQVMIARDRAGSAQGFFLAAKGGHNGESHNHNDVGNCIVFHDGKPVLIDIGVETYSRKTFSAERYSIWTMQSAWHNLPTINGTMQRQGETFAASDVRYQADDTAASLQLDLAGAYPPEAGVRRWTRTVALHRGRDVEITEDFELTGAASRVALSLVTPADVCAESPGCLRTGAVRIHFDADVLTASIEHVTLTDRQLQRTWGDGLARVSLNATAPTSTGIWTIRVTV